MDDKTKADFSAWETDLVMECESPFCHDQAELAALMHPYREPKHEPKMFCKKCFEIIHRQNLFTIRRYGSLICRGCGQRFMALKDFVQIEEL